MLKLTLVAQLPTTLIQRDISEILSQRRQHQSQSVTLMEEDSVAEYIVLLVLQYY